MFPQLQARSVGRNSLLIFINDLPPAPLRNSLAPTISRVSKRANKQRHMPMRSLLMPTQHSLKFNLNVTPPALLAQMAFRQKHEPPQVWLRMTTSRLASQLPKQVLQGELIAFSAFPFRDTAVVIRESSPCVIVTVGGHAIGRTIRRSAQKLEFHGHGSGGLAGRRVQDMARDGGVTERGHAEGSGYYVVGFMVERKSWWRLVVVWLFGRRSDDEGHLH